MLVVVVMYVLVAIVVVVAAVVALVVVAAMRVVIAFATMAATTRTCDMQKKTKLRINPQNQQNPIEIQS